MEEASVQLDDEEYFRLKSERQQRMRVAMVAVPAMIGLVTMSVPDYLDLPFPINGSAFRLIGPLMLLISGMGVLMIYLQTGFKKQTTSSFEYTKYDDELRNLRNQIEHGSHKKSPDLDLLKKEISTLKDQVNKNSSINEAITTEHRDELVSLLKTELVKESTDKASLEVLAGIEKKVRATDQLKEVESVFQKTLERLYSEISALSRRGNLNLSLGILTTIIGLAILGYFVLEIDSIPEDKMAFIAHFIPRLSLVLLIEVFAYFFLKLYKSSLSEIKYFQNEMTNAEAKLTAIKCSIMTSDTKTTSAVILALSNTERNAVLEKGQTTAEIEKSKIEQQNISTISTRVSNLLGASNAPNK
ncbi:MAG: hypothetical protein COA75_09395 [Cellvibrionales bacterium]|nr:MAG: hypothetical protein COA75_09395 [Cellvibrionales bacterium]